MARERKFSTDDLFQEAKHILLTHGYEGFTFGLLAEQLDVSRGALYKYFDNKEELITDYMLYEMNLFLTELNEIKKYAGFESQFNFLLNLIFKNAAIPQLIELGRRIPINGNHKVKENIEKLEHLHLVMYQSLQSFITLGRQENKLQDSIPDAVILGFIFQSIMIPNHFGIPHSDWVHSIKEMIRHGMLKNE